MLLNKKKQTIKGYDLKITEEEADKIIKEVAERLRDFIMITAEDKVRKVLTKEFLDSIVFVLDELEINFDFGAN